METGEGGREGGREGCQLEHDALGTEDTAEVQEEGAAFD